MAAYVIGVDAGGTKTSACVFDLEGRMVIQHAAGQGNFSEDPVNSWKNVIMAADACVEDMGKDLRYLVLGAAGIYGSGLEHQIEDRLKTRYGCEAKAVDDGTLALYGKLKGKNGVLVIAGTGSVVYGKAENTVLRNGGWGMFLDDRGSGFAIAMEALRELVHGYDAGRQLSSMEESLLEQTGCSSVHMLPRFLSRASKGEIGALAQVVAFYGQKENQDAGRILENAGRQLAIMAISAARRLALTSPAAAVSGSVLEKCRIVSDAFWKTWSREFPVFEKIQTEDRVEKGALWFYQEHKNL